jgi:hypothetical protein
MLCGCVTGAAEAGDRLEQQQVDLQALKLLLSVGSVTKVLYDCRNDAAALWYEQGCELQVRTYLRGIHASKEERNCATYVAVWRTGSKGS